MSIDERIDSFWQSWHDLNAIYEDYARRSGLTYLQLNILEIITRIENCTQKTICDNTLLPKQNVHGIVKKFEAEGLVTLKPGADDKRNRIICLTAKGKRRAAKIVPAIREAEADAMKALSEGEQVQMIESIDKYVKSLKEKL